VEREPWNEVVSVLPYRLWERRGASLGNPNGRAEECHLFLAGVLKKRKLLFYFSFKKDSGD